MRADGAAGEALQPPGACFSSTEVLALLALLACFTSTEGPALLACFTSICFTCFTLALLGLSLLVLLSTSKQSSCFACLLY